MTFSVHELPRAKADKRSIFVWLFERSNIGSTAWLEAYDSAVTLLEHSADSFGQALENGDCPLLDVKQVFFKTRRGRVYRLLYFIDHEDVYVLRVRGPGQAPVNSDELR